MKKKISGMVAFIVLVIIVCSSAITAIEDSSNKKPSIPASSAIDYIAKGTGSALITYGNSSTGIKQITVLLPWSTFQTAKTTDGITMRVRSDDGNWVQCILRVNGVDRITNQVQGTDNAATCTTHG